MHVKHAIAILLFTVLLALAAGCTTPPTGGTGGGSGPGAKTTPLPGPVVTTPPGFGIEYQVNRDQISTTPDITVFFRGGTGQIHLQKMTVQLIREDGTSEIKELVRPAGGQISVGDNVKFRGSLGTDRVIIVVTLNGVPYKIHDGYYEFKSHL